MNLRINIETLEEDYLELPVTAKEAFQVRSDGVLVDGKLYFWESILWMSIINRGLLDKLKKTNGRV